MPSYSSTRCLSSRWGKVGLCSAAISLLWFLAYARGSSSWSFRASINDEALPPGPPFEFPPLREDPQAQELNHPSFEEIWTFERALPQHFQPNRLTEMHPRPRYLFVRDVDMGSGWNNVMQELLLHSHLAELSNRSMVFHLFTPRDHPPFPDILPSGERHQLKIPLNALISGPTVGGPLHRDASDNVVRRAVSEEYFDAVCPHGERVELYYNDIMHAFGMDDEREGDERMMRWVKKLREHESRCLVVTGGSVFPWWFTGGWKILSIWPEYSTGPTLKEFAWSPLVTQAIHDHYHLLTPHTHWPSAISIPSYLKSTSSPPAKRSFNAFSPLRADAPPIPGLLAIHVRRGDYEGHCRFLVDVNSTYTTFDKFGTPGVRVPPEAGVGYAGDPGYGPEAGFIESSIPPGYKYPALPDYLSTPQGMSAKDAALAHCWPSIREMVQRVREVRQGALEGAWGLSRRQTLRTIYVSTNGDAGWVSELAQALRRDGWERVTTTLDLVAGGGLSREALAVSQVVDQGIMGAAESFIGVGFSSMTGNVVQVRLGGGREPGTIHFW